MRNFTAALLVAVAVHGAQAQITLPPLAGEARAIDLRTPAPLPPPPPGMGRGGGMECLVEPSMVVSGGSPVDGVLDEVAGGEVARCHGSELTTKRLDEYVGTVTRSDRVWHETARLRRMAPHIHFDRNQFLAIT
jgi:hypothetical protein